MVRLPAQNDLMVVALSWLLAEAIHLHEGSKRIALAGCGWAAEGSSRATTAEVSSPEAESAAASRPGTPSPYRRRLQRPGQGLESWGHHETSTAVRPTE